MFTPRGVDLISEVKEITIQLDDGLVCELNGVGTVKKSRRLME